MTDTDEGPFVFRVVFDDNAYGTLDNNSEDMEGAQTPLFYGNGESAGVPSETDQTEEGDGFGAGCLLYTVVLTGGGFGDGSRWF